MTLTTCKVDVRQDRDPSDPPAAASSPVRPAGRTTRTAAGGPAEGEAVRR